MVLIAGTETQAARDVVGVRGNSVFQLSLPVVWNDQILVFTSNLFLNKG